MTSILLEKVREYENSIVQNLQEIRPVFHVTTPIGWMNDPNGFSMFDGEIHLFFQYHPYSTIWGPMHWGHYVTKDFITWEHRPCALAPDTDYDHAGCYSGSALEVDGKHVLMYTGVRECEGQNGQPIIRQTQCIAIGDGNQYVKYEKNPVITGEMLPKGSSLSEFRDPKIWQEVYLASQTGQESVTVEAQPDCRKIDESPQTETKLTVPEAPQADIESATQGFKQTGRVFYALVASQDEEGSGQLALFSSEDMLSWHFEQILDASRHELGEMWECPDFFLLEDKQVLIVSPQSMEAEGLEFHCGNNTVYFIGEYHPESHSWSRREPHQLDYGMDFYAAQTMETEDGRRIMIAWLQNWENRLTPDCFNWCGMMTVPRELTIRNERIIQNPVREIAKYHKNEILLYGTVINHEQGEIELPGVTGRSADLTADIRMVEGSRVSLSVAADGKHRTVICLHFQRGEVSVDRSLSGMKKDVLCTRSMKVDCSNGRVKLRALIDYYSVEVFVNDGEQAMSTLIYTPINAQRIFWSCDGVAEIDVIKYDVMRDYEVSRSTF